MNENPGALGLAYIRRYANGEELGPRETEVMHATMYMLTMLVHPARVEEDFIWKGPDHFMQEIWPVIKDRDDIMHGTFGDGSLG